MGITKKEEKKLASSYKINLFDPKDVRLIKKVPMKSDRNKVKKNLTNVSLEKKKTSINMNLRKSIPTRSAAQEEKRNQSAPKLRPGKTYANYLKRQDPNIISSEQIPVESRQSLLKAKSKNDYTTANTQNKAANVNHPTNITNAHNLQGNTTSNNTSSNTTNNTKPIIKTIKEVSKAHMKGNANISVKDTANKPANLRDLNSFTLKQNMKQVNNNKNNNFLTVNNLFASSYKTTNIDLNFNFSPIPNQTHETLFPSASPIIKNLKSKNKNDNKPSEPYYTSSNQNFLNSVLSEGSNKVGFISNKYKSLIDQFFQESRQGSVGSNLSGEEKIRFFEMNKE